MTNEQLHQILDDENRKLTVDELKEVIYQLKNDCLNEQSKPRSKNDCWKTHFYLGEVNAFYICLDLLAHINIS